MAVWTSSVNYVHADWLGNQRLGSTPSRTTYFDVAYAPFGETYAASGATDPSFTSQRQDTVYGLYDFPAREYSFQGRWVSPDPAGLAAVDPTNPQSWNRYAYVTNSPLIYTDPAGMNKCWQPGMTVAGICTGGPGGYAGAGGPPEAGGGNPFSGNFSWVFGGDVSGGAVMTDPNGNPAYNPNGTPMVYDPNGPTYYPGYLVYNGPGPGGGPIYSMDPTEFTLSVARVIKTEVKYAVIESLCKGNQHDRVLTSMRNGAIFGAARGAYTGFLFGEAVGGAVTLGASGPVGAAGGALIGGIGGTIGGFVHGAIISQVCQMSGAY
jgi:RHS repeat-associated protein